MQGGEGGGVKTLEYNILRVGENGEVLLWMSEACRLLCFLYFEASYMNNHLHNRNQ